MTRCPDSARAAGSLAGSAERLSQGELELTGDRLVEVLATLASPHRLRVLAALTGGRTYVSQLARDLGISRALLQVHLKKLEKAGLVTAIVAGLLISLLGGSRVQIGGAAGAIPALSGWAAASATGGQFWPATRT